MAFPGGSGVYANVTMTTIANTAKNIKAPFILHPSVVNSTVYNISFVSKSTVSQVFKAFLN